MIYDYFNTYNYLNILLVGFSIHCKVKQGTLILTFDPCGIPFDTVFLHVRLKQLFILTTTKVDLDPFVSLFQRNFA